MTLDQILDALQYNKPMFVKGERVAMVAISEVGAFRSDDRSIRLFVTLTNKRQITMLASDLEVGA